MNATPRPQSDQGRPKPGEFGKFHRDGSRIYFRKETERTFFFIATIILLLVAAISKIGWI